MSTFRRIAAACALCAVMAMGLAAPAHAGARRDDSTASSGSLDTTLVAAAARRARGVASGRGVADKLDGRSGSPGHLSFDPSHALWLAAAFWYQPPAAVPAGALQDQRSLVPAAPLLAPRTSRGPPPRS